MENIILQMILDEEDSDDECDIVNEIGKLLASEYFYSEPKRQKNKRKRSHSYYNPSNIIQYRSDEFLEHFRMSKGTFEKLLSVVQKTAVSFKDEPAKNVSIEKKLLFTIWLLSKPESLLSVGDRFNISQRSGNLIFQFICHILAYLMPSHVNWPTEGQQQLSANSFQDKSHGIPGVIGAIDGCHIPIKQPVRNADAFYNSKQFHSIILQGVCDHRGVFIDIFVGLPGRMPDARVFTSSPLFKAINANESFISSDFHLMGDCAYPLSKYMLTPYTRDNGQLTTQQVMFNTKLASIRSVIDRAFALLKGKFRRLKYLDVKSLHAASKIVSACCLLHNFILQGGDANINDVDLEMEILADDVQADESSGVTLNADGAAKRDAIKNAL